MELERQNPHWEKDYTYPYTKKRFMFDEIVRSVKTGLITAIYGLRRVGKTVILKQIINYLIEQGIPRKDILYFSFDEYEGNFWEVIEEYEKRIGHKVSKKNYLLFDEIQKVDKWKQKIKLLYDSSFPRIIISGSNSSLIRKQGESLAGRIKEFYLPELSFKEYLFFQDKEELYHSIMHKTIEQYFWEYIRRPFPELAINKEIDAQEYVQSIAKKIIYEDLPNTFPIEEPQLLYRLFNIISKNPGMMIEYNRLASELSRNRKTISTYLDYLRYGFIVRRLFNYSTNRLTSEKKLKKFYPSLACFVDAKESRIIETVISQILKARFFWNFKNRYEVDFILEEPLYAFEVKYSKNIEQKELVGLKKFKERFKEAKEYLITKNVDGSLSIKQIPYYMLEQFLEEKGVVPKIKIEDVLY